MTGMMMAAAVVMMEETSLALEEAEAGRMGPFWACPLS